MVVFDSFSPDPPDPRDPVANYGRLHFDVIYNSLDTFSWKRTSTKSRIFLFMFPQEPSGPGPGPGPWALAHTSV